MTLAVASGIIATPAAVLNPLPNNPIHEEVGIVAPAPIERIEPLKPLEVAVPAELTPAKREGGANTYQAGQCTWGVKQWKPEARSTWGNANTWDDRAAADGWTVSPVPVVGAIAQSDGGRYGHVALVVAVAPGSVTIREMNYNFVPFSERTKVVPTGQYEYIY